MLCNEVKRVVYFFLDGSLEGKSKKDFSSHLHDCPDCEARTKFHMRLRQFLQRRLDRLCVHAPNHLKLRLTRSIRAFRAEWSR